MTTSAEFHDRDQEEDCSMCSREIDAHFVVGPARARFMMTFTNRTEEGYDDIEITCYAGGELDGGSSILSSSGSEGRQPGSRGAVVWRYRKQPFRKETFNFCAREPGQVPDDDLAAFLGEAGLATAVGLIASEHALNRDSEFAPTLSNFRRVAYAEVVYEAVELIISTHGWTDDCQVELGMRAEDIFLWLGTPIDV